MPVLNNNKLMLDRPMWEQLAFHPSVAGTSGSSMCDDGVRYIYWMATSSATVASFWRYDTWYDTWQQLATPPTTTITVGQLRYTDQRGGQYSGATAGSIYSFQANGTVCYLYSYNITTNTWSTLNTTSIPAIFATDATIAMPEPARNGGLGAFHSEALRTITTSAVVAAGATSISVAALPEPLVAGTRLKFGSFNITVTANATRGATSLTIGALAQALAVGTQLRLPGGNIVVLSAAAATSATSLSVYPIYSAISASTVIVYEQYVVLTAVASASATSITISPSMSGIASGSSAFYYGNFYLFGNNSTQIYRYNIGTATWSTTTANAGNAAFPTLPGTIGAGCTARWLPAVSQNSIFILKGNITPNAYIYDLVTNTVSTETYYQITETFGVGTTVATRSINGRQSSLLIQKDNTGRILEGRPELNTLEPKATQWLFPHSTAVIGDRSACVTSPDGVEFYYIIPHSTSALVRCAMIDN
jgi:hypothetical protein